MHSFFWGRSRGHGHHAHGHDCGPNDEGNPFHPGHHGGPFAGFGGRGGPFHGHGPWGDPDGNGALGVRRPLRFLAHKLELDDEQVAQLARVLDELKIERAQAAVDDRRTTAAFADAVASGTFDAEKAKAGAEARVRSAERLRDAVVNALTQMHALLRADQREQFAYLVRTGALSI